ncbi:hypothetical protein FACS1894186_1920 [Alphaproteobacteria bacterium]|nr:hypothetical protein FACS1894186_1920 [Alphaproteobacteria bacterium]
MTEEVIFPNQVRTFRRLRGVTMQALADELGVSLSAVSKIEKGYRRVDRSQLQKIASFLSCPVEDIFLTSDNAPPEVMAQWHREQERRAGINEGSGLKTLGAGLRYIRTRADMTLAQVAAAAKMTLSVYHRIEMGQREITMPEMDKIAEVMSMTGRELQREIYQLHKAGTLSEFIAHSDRKFYAGPKGGVPECGDTQLRMSEKLDVKIPVEGLIGIDGRGSMGGSGGVFSYPSAPALSRQAYAVRLAPGWRLEPLPASALLIADPNKIPRTGDLALMRDGDEAALVVISADRRGDLAGRSVATGDSFPLAENQMPNLHKIVLVYCE